MTEPRPFLTGGPVYLDYNATTPIDPRVVDAMRPYLYAHFGNPSSGHTYSTQPHQALERARGQVAQLIGAPPDAMVFTGSGSEANNLAIRGAVLASGKPRPHVITQCTEHPAVLATCHALERHHNTRVTYLPVNSHGLVDPQDLERAITPDSVVVSIMHANNETGVIQPITDLAHIARGHGALFHTDAAQTAGKIPLDLTQLDVDLLTVVGHKMYAPKGIGALYIRPGLTIEPVIYGGGQEHGLRAGTENVAFAVALGTAATLAAEDLHTGVPTRLAGLRDRLHHTLTRNLPVDITLNGHPRRRLPHVLNISLTGIRGDDLLAATPGVAASTGSACHTGDTQPSPVLIAMGIEPTRGLSALRLSLGRWTAETDIDRAADALTATANRLLKEAPSPT